MKTSTLSPEPVGDRALDWLGHAACRGRDPELFFLAPDGSTGRAQAEAARQVCRRCLVKGICPSWALDNDQEAGVWGGTTEHERRRLHRHSRPPG